MEDKEFDLKSIYTELGKKYSLPGFEEICEDFDIEKISDKEVGFLAREIRRTISEKISAYLHLFETLINPNGPPMFVFSLLRNISTKDKEEIREIYRKLAKTQIEIMKLDTIYKEDAEAAFVKETFEMWQELKPQIYQIVERFEDSFEQDDESKKRSYFG